MGKGGEPHMGDLAFYGGTWEPLRNHGSSSACDVRYQCNVRNVSSIGETQQSF